MNDITAAIGRANLGAIIQRVHAARENARHYCRLLSQPFNDYSRYWLYTILVPRRDDFITYMRLEDIEVSPVHRRCDRHTAVAGSLNPLAKPGTDIFDEQHVCLPVESWVSMDDVERIARLVNAWLKNC
jgi:dTDP-4-amino-4,6-dideoxygalactose transaminase